MRFAVESQFSAAPTESEKIVTRCSGVFLAADAAAVNAQHSATANDETIRRPTALGL